MPNHLTLAVAGGRKTQGLVDHCRALPTDRRVLVVTFTQTNQQELINRLGSQAGDRHNLDVLGWYTSNLLFITPALSALGRPVANFVQMRKGHHHTSLEMSEKHL
ncbi:hypothetical protein ACYZTX_16340 [Pseudomonas sp. MDT1-17]